MGCVSNVNIAVLAGVLAAATHGCGKQPEAGPEPRLVSVVEVSMEAHSGERSYSGEVRARYEASLSFRVPGKIVARQAEVGEGPSRLAPSWQAEGYRKIFKDLEAWLADITGFAATSLQPNAGSAGEYAGLLVIRAWHESRGEGRRTTDLRLTVPRSRGSPRGSGLDRRSSAREQGARLATPAE